MTTATLTLTEFLLARIEDDEACVLILNCVCGEGVSEVDPLPSCPERVLAECEAKRRIVECHDGWHECVYSEDGGANRGLTDFDAEGSDLGVRACPTLAALAAVYAEHPDYRDEWRP